MKFLYLDHAATSPMRESVWGAMRHAEKDGFGNPSGSHQLSRNAKNIVERSRESIAYSVGAAPEEIVFTSCGTESDNWSIKAPFEFQEPTQQDLVISSIEHEAVLASAEWVEQKGFNVSYVNPDINGKVEYENYISKIKDTTRVASLMWGNNETGVIQPVSEIGNKISHKKELLFHSDVVQGFVSTKIDFHKAGVNSAAMSAHKIGGPKGIGLMFLHNEYKIESYFHGGKQELERRAGTVNVVGIAGFAAAVKEHHKRFDEEVGVMLEERNTFAEGGEPSILAISVEKEQMLPDEEMEEDYVDYVVSSTLSEEDKNYLESALAEDTKLSELFDQVVESASEFSGSGPVEGLGTEVSDSIPARLSDGEFVFTAKATDEIGADVLQQQMEAAEAGADQRQGVAYGGEIDEEDRAVPIQTRGSLAAQGNVPNVVKQSRQVEEEMLKSSPRRYYVPVSG